MQRFHDLQFFRQDFFADLRSLARRPHIGELFGEFRRDFVYARLEAGRRLRSRSRKKFHQRKRRIDHGVMLLQKRNGLQSLR